MKPENELPSSPTDMSVPVRPSSSRPSPWLFIALAALLLAGWQWIETRQQLDAARQEISQRLAAADLAEKEDQGARKQMQTQLETIQARLGAADARLAEFGTQNAALQAFYQDMARSREEATLLEVEQALTLAGQQLQLAANVPVAMLALQTADSRLARLDRPQYLPLRKAVAKDLARLAALPVVDLPGINLQLEQQLQLVDKLPLASHGRPPETAGNAKPAQVSGWWQQTGDQVWQQIKGLVRIQRFDRDEPILLAPGQSFFLRENLKLRLLSARLALLSRDQLSFRNELKAVQDALTRHFVGDDKSVQASSHALRQMAGVELNTELPTLNESLAALRALRPAKEKR